MLIKLFLCLTHVALLVFNKLLKGSAYTSFWVSCLDRQINLWFESGVLCKFCLLLSVLFVKSLAYFISFALLKLLLFQNKVIEFSLRKDARSLF